MKTVCIMFLLCSIYIKQPPKIKDEDAFFMTIYTSLHNTGQALVLVNAKLHCPVV